MGRVDQHGALGRVLGLLDEGGPLLAQALDDVAIVDDLVSYVDRPLRPGEGELHDLDRSIDAGTETAGAGEQDAHGAPNTSGSGSC